MRYLALLIVLTLASARPVFGQFDTGVLAGWDAVNAQVILDWDDRIEGYIWDTVQARLETVFQLELRRLGISVSANP